MKRITELANIGIGKECLIIGGGMSVKDFDFSKLNEETITICVNDANRGIPITIDFLLYNDVCFITVFKTLDRSNVRQVISFHNNYHKGVDYTYGLRDFLNLKTVVQDSDNTGLKALVFAKKLMKFDKIYLIGFDYSYKVINGKKVSHFYGDEFGMGTKYQEELNLLNHYGRLSEMIEEYDRFKDRSCVWNCNKESALKIFPYAMPY